MISAWTKRRSSKPEPSAAERELNDMARRKKEVTRQLLRTPEIALASVVLLAWCVALIPIGGVASLLAMALVFGIGEAMLILAVSLGSHGFQYSSVAYLLVAAVSVVIIQDWNRPLGLVIAASSALFVMDATRLNFGRRRGSKVPPAVVISTFGSWALTTVLSLFSVGVVTIATEQTGQRSWLWVPAVSAILLTFMAGLTFWLGRSSARGGSGRWRPGETMVPPPTID